MFEQLNVKMAHVEFLNSPAHLRYFDDLVASVLAMASVQGRTVSVPSANEAGAWQKAYALYETLLREQNKPAHAEITARNNANAANEREWNHYTENRERLIQQVRIDLTQVRREYLGILETDLADPMVEDEKYGRVPRAGWRSVASRIEQGLARWQNMPSNEKAQIPWMVALKRLENANLELSKRVSALETQLGLEKAA
jgi:hypothetical protein